MKIIAGIDEVGRGALAGPVTAVIVLIRKKIRLKGVKDSKALTPKQREKIFEIVKDEPRIDWRISYVWPRKIDRVNIWQSTLLAWRRCLAKLERQPDFLFLDGKMSIPRLKIKQQPVVKGDQKIWLLSLASIIAKVSRDRLMERMEKKYPEYGFAQHKGYGTKLHFEKLNKFGPCQIHRRSFKPVFNNLSFQDKVYYAVSQIPRGQVMTYQQVAQQIGQPRAYRAVGNVLNKNTYAWVPCHRVVRSDGRVGGFRQGSRLKGELLRKEKAPGFMQGS